MLWLLLVGVADAVIPTIPTLAAEEAPVDRAWVLDPRTPLRDAAGAELQTLPVGVEVEVLERGDDHARVRAYDAEGWVALRSLATVPPELDTLRLLARRGGSATERLAWADRAAASSWSGYDQRVLASVLREAGADARAVEVEAALGLPVNVWLAPETRAPDLRIEYAVSADPSGFEAGPLEASELEAYGLAVGQPWWVLPAHGPAVLGRVTGASAVVANPCGGTWAIEVHVDAPLPEGADVLAFARGEPPASWHAAPAPPVGRDAVVAQVRATSARLGLRSPEITAAGSGTTWWARAAEVLSDEEGLEHVRVVDFAWDGAALRVLEDDQIHTYVGWARPVAARDLDGDGDPESVWTECARVVRDEGGAWITNTETRCCGC